MTWPQGRGTELQLAGRARDLLTPLQGPAKVLGEATMLVGVGLDRTIQSIKVTPHRDGIEKLIGARGGGHLRGVLEKVLTGERESCTPLYLLLDDISGATLIAGWAWSRWTDQWLTPPADRPFVPRRMEGVCITFSPGSSALGADGEITPHDNATAVDPLPHPDDLEGWHPLAKLEGVSMRRARRIDMWIDEVIEVHSTFQDSASLPQGGRAAVHEYALSATADPVTHELLTVKADPRVLPYPECPTAIANLKRLLGTPLEELRSSVLEELRKTAGCTHLNDALRAFAEVPALLGHLTDQDA